MKNAVIGAMLFLSCLYALLIQSMQYTEQIKTQEINAIAEQSINNAIISIYNNETSSIDEIKGVLIESAKQRFSSDGELVIDIIEIDLENKLIRAKYTSKWKQLNGKTKTITRQKNMMVDEQKGM